MSKKVTTKDFIQNANIIHNYKYNYDKTTYTKKKERLIITCLEHGDFTQIADGHLSGQGCRQCHLSTIRIGKTDFSKRANLIHNNYYTYDKVIYKNSVTKVIIICPKHGEFLQTPNSHLCGKGCYNCGWEKHSGSYGSVFKHNPEFELYIYLIRCYNENEEFYKIGLSKSVKERLWDIPYKKEILYTRKSKILELYPLEQSIRRFVFPYKYLPLHDFSGRNECFKDLNKGKLDDIFASLKYPSEKPL